MIGERTGPRYRIILSRHAGVAVLLDVCRLSTVAVLEEWNVVVSARLRRAVDGISQRRDLVPARKRPKSNCEMIQDVPEKTPERTRSGYCL